MVIGLVAVMKLPFPTATGTSLGAMLLPVGLLGAIEYYRRGHVDVRASILLAVGLTLGAWVGARLAVLAAPAQMQRLFAVFLVIMAVRLWATAGEQRRNAKRAPPRERPFAKFCKNRRRLLAAMAVVPSPLL